MKALRKNVIAALAGIVLFLIILSGILVIHNRKVMERAAGQLEFSEQVLLRSDFILNNLQAIDLGLRGYAISKHENHLGHFHDATEETPVAFDSLKVMLDKQDYKSEKFEKLKTAMDDYVEFCNGIVKHVKAENDTLVRIMIIEDRGYEAWSIFHEFNDELTVFQKKLTAQAEKEYNRASNSAIWVMVTLFAIGGPTIILIVYLLQRAEKKRKRLFRELEENNRKYNFNPGTNVDISDEYQLIDGYIENSKKAAEFINLIAKGEYDVQWEGLNEENAALNQDNLAGALVQMRDQMKAVKQENEQRHWSTQGLAQFSELLRNHQENIADLAYESTVFIVKYMEAQQGGLYIVKGEEAKERHIELEACYAFNRKKFVEKKIEVGQGLVGQAYLEGEVILLTDIPEGYTHITSGLGEATPTCLLIVPMKYNDEVCAIIEIAGFVVYEKHQIEFVEKLGEFIASAVASVQTNEITRRLLKESQQMAEEMKSQEEEMRQNMEELSATQEEMRRKEKEYIKQIEELKGEKG